MPLFILCTAAVLPLCQAACFPAAWPMLPLLGTGLAAIWLWEGVRPLFMGLYLFQLLPAVSELVSRAATFIIRAPDGSGEIKVTPTSTRGTRLTWLLALLTVLPVAGLAAVVLYSPDTFAAFLAKPMARMEHAARTSHLEGEATAPVGWDERLWRLMLACLGVGRGADDPWRVLKLPRGASAREVKKRMRELSLVYHPDKVGNNPVAHARFLAIQAAADKLIGKRPGGANALASEAARVAMDHAKEAAQRCVECVGVVFMWIATSAIGFVMQLLQAAAARPMNDAQAVQQQQAVTAAVLGRSHAPVDVSALRVRGARPLPRIQLEQQQGGADAGAPPSAQPARPPPPPQAYEPPRMVRWLMGSGKRTGSQETNRKLSGTERRAKKRDEAMAKTD